MPKKTWNEKLNDSKDLPRVEEVHCVFAMRQGGPRMLLAPPLAFDAVMKQIPKGKLITPNRIRAYLAKQHNADWACGLVGGIFINVSANAAAERKDTKHPWWRTLKKDGELNEKYPDGIDGHKLMLEMEGHKVIQKGKRYFVENYTEKLHEIDK